MLIKKAFFLNFIYFIYIFSANQTIGSDSTVAAPQANIEFDGGNNKIASYALMKNGFSFLDSSTTCSWYSVFPISSDVLLKGGTLYLNKNFIFSDSASISTPGRIYGNNNNFIISKNLDNLPYFDENSKFIFRNINLVLNGDFEFQMPVKFEGNCNINGRGNKLFLTGEGSVQALANSNLILENLELLGLQSNNLSCVDNSASLVLRNVKMDLSSNLEFDFGSILFSGKVMVQGSNGFVYQSSLTSSLDSNTFLYFDKGSYLDYNPLSLNHSLLSFKDSSSCLYLDGASLVVSTTGLVLTKGTLLLDNDVTFSVIGNSFSEALRLGDGNIDNDINIKVLAAANINVYGPISYENIE